MKRPHKRAVRVANIASAKRSGFAADVRTVVAIDSSKKLPAWVLGLGYYGPIVIESAGFDENPGTGGVCKGWTVDVAVYEHARCRPSDPRPQDILDETAGGALTAGSTRAGKIVQLFPEEWTSGASKPARHDRIWNELAFEERAIISDASGMSPRQIRNYIDRALDRAALGRDWTKIYTHRIKDLLDAAGILLFAVGRMGKGARPQRARPLELKDFSL